MADLTPKSKTFRMTITKVNGRVVEVTSDKDLKYGELKELVTFLLNR